MDVDSLNLAFVLWWLFFAVFHVEAECAVQSAAGVKSAVGMFLWLDAAIIINEVNNCME